MERAKRLDDNFASTVDFPPVHTNFPLLNKSIMVLALLIIDGSSDDDVSEDAI